MVDPLEVEAVFRCRPSEPFDFAPTGSTARCRRWAACRGPRYRSSWPPELSWFPTEGAPFGIMGG